MKDSLVVGLTNEMKYAVEEGMTPAHLTVPVLSTPSMIGMIEGTCLLCTQPHLDSNETTVGVHVNVSHTGPANVGEEVTVQVELKEINKRRLLFEIEVLSVRGSVSTGTHQRAVVDLERMAQRGRG